MLAKGRGFRQNPRVARATNPDPEELVSVVTSSKAAKLGTKRECRSCEARFYDLNKEPPVCPKCGAIFDVNAEPELKPLPPDEDESVEEERKKKKKRGRDPLDAVERGRLDAGDDDAAETEPAW
jgi:uncharacterized protein (TIGR02300 family)